MWVKVPNVRRAILAHLAGETRHNADRCCSHENHRTSQIRQTPESSPTKHASALRLQFSARFTSPFTSLFTALCELTRLRNDAYERHHHHYPDWFHHATET